MAEAARVAVMIGGTDPLASVDARSDADMWLRSVAESIASAVGGVSVVACLYRRDADGRLELRQHRAIQCSEGSEDCEGSERHVIFLRARASDDDGCLLGIVREGVRRDDDVARAILARIEAHLALAYRRRLAKRDQDASATGARHQESANGDAPMARLARLAGPGVRRLDAIDAAALRRMLLGRAWSVLDGHRRDGRFFVVAHAPDASPCDRAQLTEREREVVSRVAVGQANKCIAYELGIETSTVAQLLRRALTRLGLSGRAERAAFFGEVRERLVAHADD